MAYKEKDERLLCNRRKLWLWMDIECNCEDRADAKAQLKTYRENSNLPCAN